jgi:diguanylate cyclase (GGDEF)-like protein/PAS domain S-box-containing protein
LNKATILVVEDNLSSLRLLTDTLAGEGYRVLPADSGELALASMAANRPDLILLDIRMPGMDGFELIRRLKARTDWHDIPVIFLSAADDHELRVEAFRLGAVDYINKPFQHDELLARVRTHVDLFQLRADLERQAEELRTANEKLQALRFAERNQAEATRQAMERRFLDIVNTTDGIVWEADAATFTFTFISEKAERLLGFPAGDWQRPGFWVKHLHPDDLNWAPEFCASCTGRLEPHDFEYRFIASDGRTVWLRDMVTVVAENGRPRWLRGVMIDVTKQKALEAELREAYQLVDEVQRLSKLGGWRYDCATARIKWTDEVYRIYGVGPEFDPSDPLKNVGFYHPEDAPTIADAFRRAVELGEAYDMELRLIRKDDQQIWVRTIGNPQLEHGVVVRVTGNIIDISERKAAEEKIRALAFYDPLTGLPNRRLLFDRLHMALASCARSQHRGALLFIDLDNFKTINDSLGHDIGDLLLQEAAQRLKTCIREGDTVARLGGDEFVVMLEFLEGSHDNAVAQATTVGEKVLDALGAAYSLAGNQCRSTPSIGIALFDGHPASENDILKKADLAMYRAKKAGRNQVRIYDPKCDCSGIDRAAAM